METKYYEYVGTQKQADGYAEPIPIIGNIYPDDAKIGWYSVSYWGSGSDAFTNEWKLVEKELSTQDLIELLNKKAAKDGMTCSVTFDKNSDIKITDFQVNDLCYDFITKVSFFVNLNPLKVQSKQSKLIESIKNVLEND
jgi:hypothetical protein